MPVNQCFLVLFLALLLTDQRLSAAPQTHFQALQWESKAVPQIPAYGYRLYIPPGANSENRLPLMVWFHGSGDRGNDNSKQLSRMEVIFEANGDRPPLFILVPQHHVDEGWSEPAQGQPHDALWVSYQIMQGVLAQYCQSAHQNQPGIGASKPASEGMC
jgi:predicted peptidase